MSKVDNARILYVYADNALEKFYCSNWLCSFPAYALDRAGYAVGMAPIDEFVKKPRPADLYIVERLLWNGSDSVIYDKMPKGPTRGRVERLANLKVLDRIVELQAKGSKVAAVFDDHYAAYPRDTDIAEPAALWLDGRLDDTYIGYNPLEHFKNGLGIVNAVFSPSKYLLDFYVEDKSKAYHVHNRPNLDIWQRFAGAWVSEDDKVRVGWSGTAQHVTGWQESGIVDVLRALKDKIVLVGVMSGDKMLDMVEKSGVEHRIQRPVPFEQFPDVVRSYDIGICPLGGEYDKGRSWIKWLECSLAGKPVVAQDHAGVYDECHGGYLVKTKEDWIDALSYLIECEEEYRLMSEAGRAWAWAQGWDENLSELTSIFEEILE